MLNRYYFNLSFFCLLLLAQARLSSQSFTYLATVYKNNQIIYVFNGIADAEHMWGSDLVYIMDEETDDEREMGALGGLPVVDVYGKDGGISVFNLTNYFEPFSVKLVNYSDRVEIFAKGGSNIEIYEHTGDYFDSVREFALRMKAKGLSVQPAPRQAFNITWETYGYEENWTKETVIDKIPLLKELGIKTITLDSGWFGDGSGPDWDAQTGDFPVNPDIIGTEQDLIDLIDTLHAEGFIVKAWTIPGVSEKGTVLYSEHPDWFYVKAESSTGETDDWYLDPENPDVIEWSKSVLNRFLAYGFDGFKQDDVYEIISDDTRKHIEYEKLFSDIYESASQTNPLILVNTCNCGLAQNFYQMSGENQLITSDPLGAGQVRRRAKYLHALNVNGAAILGDHVELTRGDVSSEDLDEEGFYDSVDFASIVALGMALETKFKDDPGSKYRKWMNIYNSYKFYEMDWVNIPLTLEEVESYLLKNNDTLYFSFFTPEVNDDNQDWLFSGQNYSGNVTLTHLSPGKQYSIYDISSDLDLGVFTADSDTRQIDVNFYWSILLEVKPTGVASILNSGGENVNSFKLDQNYPNPFSKSLSGNATTTIKYSVPSVAADAKSASSAFVQLKVYDLLGREVATLVNGEKKPGNYEAKFNAEKLTSGIYFYSLRAGSFRTAKKMIVLE